MGVERSRLKLTPAQQFRAVAIGLVVGAGLLPLYGTNWPVAIMAAFVSAAAAWLVPSIRYVALVLVGICSLLASGSLTATPPPTGVFVGEQTFTARVAAAPRAGDRVTRYVVTPDSSQAGQVLLVAYPYPVFHFGDLVQVTCKTMVEEVFAAFRNRGIYRTCAFPELQLISAAPPSVRVVLYTVRDSAGKKLKQLLPEPYGSLTTGMLWGDDAELPRQLVESFRRTGTSHLLAVSGYNVMVLTEILFWVLVSIGLWRRPASIVVLVLVALFVLFTGAEPAVVRAGIMGSLLVVARLVGRRPDKLNLLFGAAAAMLFIDPNLSRDLGFQLSFAAMAGLLFVAPRLYDSLRLFPKALGLRAAASQTLAATITTTPIILASIGSLSLVSPLANLLVGPVIVAVFGLGLPALLLSLAAPWLATPVALALAGVLAYVVWIVEQLAALPVSSTVASLYTWLAVVLVYITLTWWLVRSRASAL